jgi:hypothetical protein
MNNKKNIAIVVLVLVVLGVGYYLLNSSSKEPGSYKSSDVLLPPSLPQD